MEQAVDLNKLQVFVAVARQGSVRGAADSLSVTPSAVSQTIASLEASLGITLLDRIGRRIALTEQGRRLFRASEKHQTELYQSVREVLQLNTEVRGEITIGAYLEFTKTRLMDVLESFLADNPHASLRFRFDAPSRLERLLRENTIDIAFSIHPPKEQTGIQSTPLYREELVLVGRPERLGPVDGLTRLLQEPVIDYYHSHRLFQRWLRHHFGRTVNCNVRSYAATAEMVLELVRRNIGIGVVPRYVAEPALQAGELTVYSPTKNDLHDFVWMNELSGPFRSNAFQLFRSEVVRAFSGAGL